jgi:mono/diheme cytochrome c family protein
VLELPNLSVDRFQKEKRMRISGMIPAAIIAMAAAAWSGPAVAAEYGDAKRGAETAERLCVNCHALPGGPQASAEDAAPPFETIAQRDDITEESLQTTLSAEHGPMPTDTLSRQERADVIAYLLSLKEG